MTTPPPDRNQDPYVPPGQGRFEAHDPYAPQDPYAPRGAYPAGQEPYPDQGAYRGPGPYDGHVPPAQGQFMAGEPYPGQGAYPAQDPYAGHVPPGQGQFAAGDAYPAPGAYPARETYPGQTSPAQGQFAAGDAYPAPGAYPARESYPAQDPYAGQHTPSQGQFAAQDPYAARGAYPGPDAYGGHVPPPQGQFAGQDPYAGHVPPGGQGFGAVGGEPYGAQGYGGEPYVPEPLGGQLPAQADPVAAYGVPSPGGVWGGQEGGEQAYRGPGPGAVDGWGQPPAAAPAWDGRPDPARGATGPAAPRAVEQTAVMEPIRPEPAPGSGEAAGGTGATAAPVRTGSPIIAPGIQPAALTALLGLLLAGGAAVGRPLLAVVLVLLEGVTAAGWFRLNGMWPARQGIVLAFLAGVTADVALLVANGAHSAEVLLGTLGGWLLLVLVLQLRHHGSADERLASLTATSASTLLTVVAAGWLGAAGFGAGADPVVVGAIAVAAATVVRAVRLPLDAASMVLAVLAATVTGLLTGPATGLGTGHAALLAAVCGACAVVGLRVASYDFPSRFVHFTAGVALPLTAAAPAVYLLGDLWS